ncbi:NAD-dependent epimerase/dehydratase family protein [uncultured Methanoregula sp.]|uniref:NAD-dependent epimerase/dehydratase family protein n=1 Tax=uncultured Methanoregula sp. TaxID=1005933 RepID=UPI002AAA705A|nr:NAD-dependent epimerase/dehydratase family protein [uncultured Methanoregula sp.]
MKKQKKTILVTGGSGFIGRNISEFFRDTATVIAPTHAQLDLLSQDAVNKFLKENEINYVIHCANIGGNRKSVGPTDSVAKNARLFFNIAENSRYYEKLIHFGSGAEYDKRRSLSQISEVAIGESIPVDDYGFSKYLISKYIEKSENIVCLRLFGVFGKYEDYEYKFISNSILKNLLHMPVTIRQNVYFDWLFIDDLMKIVRIFLEKNAKYPAYNITPGKPTDLVTLANLINSCSEIKSDIIIDNPGLNAEYSGNNLRLLAETGSFQFTPMPAAISELREYYCSIIDQINSDVIKKDEYAKFCTIRPQS